MSVKQQIDELTGLRGVAALFILFNHILLIYPRLRGTLVNSPLGWFGYMGMDLFFILSGFVICYNYADRIKNTPKTGIREFLVARIARLYPLYLLFLVFFFVYNIFASHFSTTVIAQNITSLPIFLTGMQSWFYGFIGDVPVVHLQGSANISWSISTEFALYLFFIPLVWVLLKINSRKAYIFSIVSLILLQLSWLYFSYHDNVVSVILNKIFGAHENYSPSIWLSYHSPMARIWQFLCGCVIAKSYTPELRGKGGLRLFSALKYLSILAICFFVFSSPFIKYKYPMYLTSSLLVLFTLAVVHSGDKILKSKFFIFLGEVSYSTYLLHIIFVQFLTYNGQHMISYIINLPVFFACTYVTAFFVYKYYEMPMRKKVKDFLLDK